MHICSSCETDHRRSIYCYDDKKYCKDCKPDDITFNKCEYQKDDHIKCIYYHSDTSYSCPECYYASGNSDRDKLFFENIDTLVSEMENMEISDDKTKTLLFQKYLDFNIHIDDFKKNQSFSYWTPSINLDLTKAD